MFAVLQILTGTAKEATSANRNSTLANKKYTSADKKPTSANKKRLRQKIRFLTPANKTSTSANKISTSANKARRRQINIMSASEFTYFCYGRRAIRPGNEASVIVRGSKRRSNVKQGKVEFRLRFKDNLALRTTY